MRRSSAVAALGVLVILTTLSIGACGRDDVPAAPETAGVAEPDTVDADTVDADTVDADTEPTAVKPRAAADPAAVEPAEVVQPTPEPAGDVPELWSIIDPALDTDRDRDCSPFSIERDYLNGTLTPDDFTRYALFGPWDPDGAPEQYRPCPDVNLLSTAGVLWGRQFVEYASPAVQEEVDAFFTPTFVPDEG